MTPKIRHRLYASFAGAWIIAFCVETGLLAHTLYQWTARTTAAEILSNALLRESSSILLAIQQIKNDDQEITFLEGLVDVLPQEKSFLRTESAMSDEVDSLRAKVGRRVKNDLHILVDTQANKLYLKRGLTLLWQADCSVGKGGLLVDRKTGRRWEFVTPKGQFEIQDKYEKPVWVKPDWAFVEAGQKVPPPGDPSRRVEGELGNYVFNLGDGYLIHGTKTEALLGHSVSHGCVRLGAADLQKLYETVPRGTRVYIY